MRINNVQIFNCLKPSKKEKQAQNINNTPISSNLQNARYPGLTYFCRNIQNKDRNTYFINMENYGKNPVWADTMLEYDNKIAEAIDKGTDFDEIVNMAMEGVKSAYDNENWLMAMGIEKKSRITPFWVRDIYGSRGKEYFRRYAKKTPQEGSWSPRANEEYKEAGVCNFKRISPSTIEVKEGFGGCISNLELAKREYDKLISLQEPTEDEINRSVATIHWLIAQESPFQRGSDSIANLITKAIYHAYNMETSPIKKGHSLDFEAWDTDLEDYIEQYPDLFEARPHKIEE